MHCLSIQRATVGAASLVPEWGSALATGVAESASHKVSVQGIIDIGAQEEQMTKRQTRKVYDKEIDKESR